MAVVNTLSTELTNINAGSLDLPSAREMGSRLRIKSATVAVASGDDDTSTFRFFRVRSSDSIKSIQLYHDSVTGGSDYDCGLYTINNGAVVDADLYADGVTVAVATPAVPHVTATAPYIELRYGDATTSAITDVNNKVWEDLGLSADPQLEYDLVLTANTVGTADGDLTIVMLYTAGD
jgi:hypothetical protein